MAHTGHYSWQDVMLGIDIQDEAMSEAKSKQDVLDKKADEAEMMGWANLGASVLCGSIFGPIGSFLCGQVATLAVDYHYDWEDDIVDEGKFYKSKSREFNKARHREAADQTKSQTLDAMIDLGMMYVQSGGLTAEPGEWDPTTYGSGGEAGGEWSVFGKGDATIEVPGVKLGGVYVSPPSEIPNPDYVPSLLNFGGGKMDFLSSLLKSGKTLGSMATAQTSVNQLGKLVSDYFANKKKGEKEKDIAKIKFPGGKEPIMQEWATRKPKIDI